MSYLNDFEFLRQLNETKMKTTFAKIISLDMSETPQEEIIGQVVSGNINVDGTSSLRRTCSLNLIAKNINLHSFYWGLSTKFQLFIGLENNINSNYPNIIWFPQGIYIITNFSSQQSTNSYNISISGKDKMCLLDGSVGGTITANSIRFDEEGEEQDNKDIIYKKAPLERIIYQLVNELGGEKISNIIIKNLEEYGLEMLEYWGDTPLYLLITSSGAQEEVQTQEEVYQVYIDDSAQVYYKEEWRSLSSLSSVEGFIFNNLSPIDTSTPSKVTLTNETSDSPPSYTVVKREKGEAIGYRTTDLIYPGELIAKSGETLTSVLDKIRDFLNNFEYFYDVNGKFVFQKIKNSLQIEMNSEYKNSNIQAIDLNSYSNLTYDFSNNILLSSLSNTPNLQKIKNDYTIWGVKKLIDSGNEIPIHFRYAIHNKPKYYYSYYQQREYTTSEECDWRELIYQMAIDYQKYSHKEDFLHNVYNAGKNQQYYPGGITSYESFYLDMASFWRELYNPNPNDNEKDKYFAADVENNKYWTKNIEDPSLLNFWIDFLDTDGDINKFSISQIGNRPFVDTDSKIDSLYFKDVPLVIFYNNLENSNTVSGYTSILMGKQNIENFFDVSTQGKSAKEKLDELFYQYVAAQETISLSSIPIYYLQPNTLIKVKDEQNLDINGKYIIKRLSYSLTAGSLMNIQAEKLVDKIY